MAGKLPIKTSPHVEAWNANREAYEQTFQWTPGNLAGTVVFCVAIPTGIYQLIKAEFNAVNDYQGIPRRVMP
ncbi:hypothetical protein RI054_09g49270 [Pseudoscourfieldia marina]